MIQLIAKYIIGLTNSYSNTPSQESSIVILYKNFYKRLLLIGTTWIKRAGLRKAVWLHDCFQTLLLFCAARVTVSEGAKSLISTEYLTFSEKVFVGVFEIICVCQGEPLVLPPCQRYLIWNLKILFQVFQRLYSSAFSPVICGVYYIAQ